MKPEKIKQLLINIQNGSVSVDSAMEKLAKLPFADLGHTLVDHHRTLRTGFPEVIFGESKTVPQITAIIKELATTGENVLVTRVKEDKAQKICSTIPDAVYHKEAASVVIGHADVKIKGVGKIVIVTAGTSDIPIAKEAELVAKLSGNETVMVNDVGVAGVHRLFHRLDLLRSATVIIVVAGMEGTLPSVIGGLVACPVIAVPSSVGYGANFNGVTALLGMLSSCTSGITVVNIDNGFGAGYAAALMNRIGTNRS
jgi:NCAIR mutase (PurE)-related protein